MAGAVEVLEHAEHAAHAGHGNDHGKPSKLGMFIGITMATLGVMLAVAAARVGSERTELVETMVEQQNAHAKYQAQDIKHRVAFLTLQQVHASIPAATAGEAVDAAIKKTEAAIAADAGKTPGLAQLGGALVDQTRALRAMVSTELTPNKVDAAALAKTVDRYFHEAAAAKEWVESYEAVIKAHVVAQERYENAQLLAEIGIVFASVALLLHRKAAWFVALVLGAGAIAVLAITFLHTRAVVDKADDAIEETSAHYKKLRSSDKSTDAENALMAEVRAWAGVVADAPDPHGGGHGEKPEPKKE